MSSKEHFDILTQFITTVYVKDISNTHVFSSHMFDPHRQGEGEQMTHTLRRRRCHVSPSPSPLVSVPGVRVLSVLGGEQQGCVRWGGGSIGALLVAEVLAAVVELLPGGVAVASGGAFGVAKGGVGGGEGDGLR